MLPGYHFSPTATMSIPTGFTHALLIPQLFACNSHPTCSLPMTPMLAPQSTIFQLQQFRILNSNPTRKHPQPQGPEQQRSPQQLALLASPPQHAGPCSCRLLRPRPAHAAAAAALRCTRQPPLRHPGPPLNPHQQQQQHWSWQCAGCATPLTQR